MRNTLLALAAVTGLRLTGASAAPITPLDDTLYQRPLIRTDEPSV